MDSPAGVSIHIRADGGPAFPAGGRAVSAHTRQGNMDFGATAENYTKYETLVMIEHYAQVVDGFARDWRRRFPKDEGDLQDIVVFFDRLAFLVEKLKGFSAAVAS